jgi:hypothetical protein
MSDIIEVIKDVTTVTIASDGPQGPQGPTGNTGPTGPAGPPGADGVSGVISVVAPITNTGTSTAAILGINAGVANGVATLDSGGKIPQSQIPAVAITNTFVVASQAAMLALTAEEGDVAVRTDLNKTFILTATPASTLANWQELLTPTDSVLSVDGLTGAVDLTGKYSQLTAANTFLAQNIFNASSTSVVDLIVRASASQTAALQQWQDSSNVVMSQIVSNGALRIGTSIAATGVGVNLDYLSASAIGIAVRGAASQTASLQQWQLSDGTASVIVDAIGRTSVGTTNVYGVNQFGRFSARGNGAQESYSMDINGSTSATALAAVVRIRASVATEPVLVVQGFSAQTGDLQRWNNSSGTVLFSILSNGRVSTNQRTNFGFPIASAVFDAQNNFSNDTDAARVVMLVRGAASQTANLQEWQNSGGTVLVSIDSAGSAYIGGSLRVSTTSTYSARLAVNTAAAGNKGLVIQAVASQTANLFEAQDSGATAQAWITSTGSIQLLSGGTTRPIGWNTGAAARATINTTNNGDLTFAVGGNSTLLTLRAVGGVASDAVFQTATAGSHVVIVKGTTSQSGDLQQWQNVSATVLTSVNASGTINFNTGNTSATANTGAVALPALAVGFITMQVAGTTVKVPYYAN